MKKKKFNLKTMLAAVFTVSIILSATEGAVFANADPAYSTSADDQGRPAVASRFKELLFGKKKKSEDNTIYLCPGGCAFGVKICGVGVTVSKTLSDTSRSTLMADDRIIKVNGNEVFSVDDIREILDNCNGDALRIEILRNGKRHTLAIEPERTGSGYHLGVLLSDSAAGIGTITYYNPATGEFGGLGHGISGNDGNEVLKMTRGQVTGVIMAGASKGEAGKPGELRGVLTEKTLGTVLCNTDCGVFGVLDKEKAKEMNFSEAIPIATKDEICEGEATILSTVKNGKCSEYSIQIHEIDRSSNGSKSFKIRVSDEALIAMTGGIVRGMSGSTIIQNGKIVGAVTHVMVANPTEGYGIFIENMLSAAQIPMAKAS